MFNKTYVPTVTKNTNETDVTQKNNLILIHLFKI